jgi:hypothetical protein
MQTDSIVFFPDLNLLLETASPIFKATLITELETLIAKHRRKLICIANMVSVNQEYDSYSKRILAKFVLIKNPFKVS